MARLYSFLFLLIVVCLSLANADIRARRSPQFSQASASAGAFGNPRGFGRQNFGPPRPPIFGRPGLGNRGFGRPSSGATINIAKSISISTGGRGGGAASSASAGGFGK